MKTSVTLLTTALLASPLTVLAAQSDYTYIEGDFIATGEGELEGNFNNTPIGVRGEEDYDGFGFKGSIDITPNLFIESAYDDIEVDDGDSEFEFLSGGLGLRTAIGNNANPLDLYGVVTYESVDGRLLGADFEADGYGITGGLRWQASPQLEINPYISHLDYGEIDDSDADLDGLRFGVDGVFNVNDVFALTAGYRMTKLEAEDSTGSIDLDLENEIRLGGRIYLTK
ncbi:hypothetical protein RM531_14880 [Salinisphaera sp. P385]|uniref:Outer membrane protein beta-barrel domain-containing protein n=1 Tax=Spectribacter acetivorans TaxID=3075603 RepID=A0ABU3BCL4_9GAMM|nr:hypothetical protein [Salinisphaera sp. P385]MDT0619760.1 hypothetical protein [Salinisphaera sp. P385]